MKIVATTSLPAVDRPNTDRWNAACSCQYMQISELKKKKNAQILAGQVSTGQLIFG